MASAAQMVGGEVPKGMQKKSATKAKNSHSSDFIILSLYQAVRAEIFI